ncbi:hypothetical protein pdam_00003332 [Pocillopora damicornis]|uniref:Uncharacterized protein n=1 Tax=Pocillopora damicornis TaxID=46731 RepID=A0A3M6T9X1_POCDA|nr:hypothetical protein pdam_00003332 [Pocillopora damicornis]
MALESFLLRTLRPDFGSRLVFINVFSYNVTVAVEGADRDPSEAPNGQSNGKIKLQKAVWKETKAS